MFHRKKVVVVINTEILVKNLEKLSKCKGLSDADLQGRYKNSYNRLKEDLKESATAYLWDVAINNIRWHDLEDAIGHDTTIKAAEEVNGFINNTPEGKAIMKEVSHAVYTECSFESLTNACLKMREQIKHIVWKYAPKEWDRIENVLT